jgi:hypothetical protein
MCLGVAALAVNKLLNPQNFKGFASQQKDTENMQFTFGSYPTVEELENLKKKVHQRYFVVASAVTRLNPFCWKKRKQIVKILGCLL